MKKLLLVGMVLLSAHVSFAEEAEAPKPRSQVGVYVGPDIPTTSGGLITTFFAARIGTQLGQSQFAKGYIGLMLGYASLSQTIAGVTENDSSVPILAEYVAREAFGTGFYFGARAGLTLLSSTVSANGNSASGSASAFTFAPVVGYEIVVSSVVDIDLDASWVTRTATSMSFPTLGLTVNANTGQAVLLLAGINYHF